MNGVLLAGRLECEQPCSDLKRGDLKRLTNLKGNEAFTTVLVGHDSF